MALRGWGHTGQQRPRALRRWHLSTAAGHVCSLSIAGGVPTPACTCVSLPRRGRTARALMRSRPWRGRPLAGRNRRGFSAAGSAGWGRRGLAIHSMAGGGIRRVAAHVLPAASLSMVAAAPQRVSGGTDGRFQRGTRAAGPAGPWRERSSRAVDAGGAVAGRLCAGVPGAAPRGPPVSPEPGTVSLPK